MTSPQPTSKTPAKSALRDQVEAARKELTAADLADAARRLCEITLAQDAVRRAASIALYVSVGAEPGTGQLLDALYAEGSALGKRVLLPVVTRAEAGPGLDLDWAPYAGPASLVSARMGLLEPATARLGRDAIATCDLVLIPGLAVSSTGDRLGKGAGCYDRALSRIHPGTLVWVLLHEGETHRDVPVEPHDRRVDAAITPSGFSQLTRA